MNDINICGWRGNVTRSLLFASLKLFATLVTRIDLSCVAAFLLVCHACHARHVGKVDALENQSAYPTCFHWLIS